MLTFRDLTAADIDCRVARITAKGCQLLLYKDARCDMSILDETVSAEKWQRRHYECKGNLYCSVGIKCADEWVWKDDCGAESNTEKEKGEASDSFKRACVNWGIGRELYTAPFVWIQAKDMSITEDKGKARTNDKFAVEKILIQDKRIVALAIKNATTKKRAFVWQEEKQNA